MAGSFIVDAGPFIHLEQIGCLSLLKRLPTLFVPASVFSEITYGSKHAGFEAIKRWNNAKIISVKPYPAVLKKIVVGRKGLGVRQTFFELFAELV